jgi:nitrite reductase/ring-hydroxylating ferredoxin subunit
MPPALIALLSREQLPEGKPHLLLHPPDHLVVVRLGDEVFALDQRCSHAGASLINGAILGRSLACRAHGCRFDLASGLLLGPSDEPLRQRTWLVERRGDAWAILDQPLPTPPSPEPPP